MVNKTNEKYRCKLDLYQYKMLWKMPATLKKLTEDSGYTYLRVQQLCKMFEMQGLVQTEVGHVHEYKLTDRGKIVVELLDKIYSQIEN